MNAKALALMAGGTVMLSSFAHGEDWTQYRGPYHDGTSHEQIKTTCPAGRPRAAWRAPLTDARSTLVIGDGKAFTLVAREVEGAMQEVCLARDDKTGQE